MAVVFAKVFMSAYPVLLLDQTTLSADQQPDRWASAMTYKFVGALRSLTDDKPYQRTAIWVGVFIGFATELLRKVIKSRDGYQKFVKAGKVGFSTDFLLDAVVLPHPTHRHSAASSTFRRRRGSPRAACSRASSTACPKTRTNLPHSPRT